MSTEQTYSTFIFVSVEYEVGFGIESVGEKKENIAAGQAELLNYCVNANMNLVRFRHLKLPQAALLNLTYSKCLIFST